MPETKKSSEVTLLLLLLLLIFTSGFATIAMSKTLTDPTTKKKLIRAGAIVPLYVRPESPYWDKILAARKDHPNVQIIVIINPLNGPNVDKALTQRYLIIVQKLQSAGVVVLGYTPTDYALKRIGEVIKYINTYKTQYHVNGILFDEMPTAAGMENYYKDLNSYAKSQNLTFTAGNPGGNISASYLGILDNLIIYENAGLPSFNYLDWWHSKYHDKKIFSITAYDVDNFDRSFIINATSYINYIYLTNNKFPNPWDSLPPYFNDLVATLDQQ